MEIGLLVLAAIGFGGGMLYERRKWRKVTGFNRADQFKHRQPPPPGEGPNPRP